VEYTNNITGSRNAIKYLRDSHEHSFGCQFQQPRRCYDNVNLVEFLRRSDNYNYLPLADNIYDNTDDKWRHSSHVICYRRIESSCSMDYRAMQLVELHLDGPILKQ